MLSVPCHVSLCLTPTNPQVFLRPSVLISSPSTSMTDLTHQCFVLLSSLSPSFSLYISLFLSLPLPLLCSPTRLLVTSLPCCSWLCTTDCVLYQSLTCVLVQHLPAPCSSRPAELYAVAAVTERKVRLLLCLRMPSPV